MKKQYFYSILVIGLLILNVTAMAHAAELQVDSVDDLNKDGVIIAVQSGTTSDLYAADNLQEAEIKGFESFDLAIEAVVQEDAHVALGDLPVIGFYAVENPDDDVEVVGTFGEEELFGIGIREDSNELEDALNAALHNIIESGEYDDIYSKWFSGEVVLTDDSTSDTATEFPTNTTDSTLGHIIETGELAFGSDTAYAPFEYTEDDTVKGFDVDIAKAIGEEFTDHYNTTIDAVMQSNPWDSIIPDLQNEKFDAILSAMTKTEERDQQIDFTRSYYTSAQGILQGPKEYEEPGALPIPIFAVLLAVAAIPLLRRLRR